MLTILVLVIAMDYIDCHRLSTILIITLERGYIQFSDLFPGLAAYTA